MGPTFERKIESRFGRHVLEKNKVSFRVSFLKRVIETGDNESRFHVFDSTAGNVIEKPLNRDDFNRVLYDTLPRNDE